MATRKWTVEDIRQVTGVALESVQAVSVAEGASWDAASSAAVWTLRGVVSNERYVNPAEREALEAVQEPLGRTSSKRAVLIPVGKFR